MSLNNIQLKSSMLADLYKNSLVETPSAISASQTKPLKYLGNNQKHIIVIVSHDSVPFLPDGELNFLSNVLAACKLSIADIAIVNNSNIKESDLQTMINTEANKVLLFGIEPLAIGLPINFPAFQLQPFNSRTYLYAPELSQIESDKGLKARLWTSLKTMFEI
jgi:predicted regulator of Ras-like GTPase activity (Roadblock/LC7/MglB family)